MDSPLMTWKALKCVIWAVMSSVSTSQLLPFFIQTGTVTVFPNKCSTRIVESSNDCLVPQPWLFEALYLPLMSTWSSLRLQAGWYMHLRYQIPMPTYSRRFRVIILYIGGTSFCC